MSCTKGAFAVALLATTALVPNPAAAQTVTWDGSASSDWNDPANWDTNTVPTAADDVLIDETLPSVLVDIGPAVNAQAEGLIVGNAASPVVDQLHIAGGGTLATTDASFAGFASGSAGAISVFGAGSQWNSSNSIILGASGAGSLLVLNGGQVANSATASLALLDGSFGIATVDGAGSTWTNSELLIAYQGEGYLFITDQGQVSNGQGYIGWLDGGVGTVVVDGAGSTWTNTQNLQVGMSGDGTLGIQGGGSVTSVDGIIGSELGGSGTAIVTGAGSSWTMTGLFAVGQRGAGTLIVENGGQAVNTGDSYVGMFSDGVGDATVTGAGSNWTSGDLYVGFEGDGALTVADGGAVSATAVHLGYEGGSQGSLTVTGAGSTLTSTGNLTLGTLSGSGGVQATLTISDGGAVSNAIGFVGTNVGDDAQVTVTGAGSTWTNNGNLAIGTGGSGTLSILDGGQVSNNQGHVGLLAVDGEAGMVTVSGPGSTWTNNGLLTVGTLGDGTLNILDGGAVTSTGATLGFDTGAEGSVTVSGAGSSWTSSGNFIVGNFGEGTLDIADLGMVSVSGDSFIGLGAGSQGAVTVTDGSWAMNGVLFVGPVGSGTLVIDNGLVSNTVGAIGNSVGSHGAVTVTNGATWSNSSVLFIGSDATSTLSIDGGSLVTNTDALVGNTSSAIGAITVSGAGSTWITNGNLMLGGNGQGALTIADQGTVNVGGDASLGQNFSGDGIATVTGAGSLFSVGGNLFVGEDGDSGALEIADQGVVDVAGNSAIGFGADTQGAATVTGAGSTWTTVGVLNVGLEGDGTLDILGGGTVTSADGVLGNNTGSSGDVSVTGAGSNWTLTNNLVVGGGGAGVLAIENGGQVTAVGESNVGFFAGVTGDASVTGAGSSWTTGQLNVGIFGIGAVTIADGGTLTSSFANIGQLNGSQGAVTVTGAGSTWTAAGVLNVGNDGLGTLTIADGGTVASTDGVLGRNPNSSGSVDVSGAGSNWTMTNTLIVGGGGAGALTIEDGGHVAAAGNSNVGFFAGVTGDAAVTGAGSSWTTTGQLNVGVFGTGAVTVADGGALASSLANIGQLNGSQGAVTVTGAGSTWTNSGNLVVGNVGQGALTVADGAVVSSGTAVTIASQAGSQGTVNIGAAAGDAPAAAGTLDTPLMQFGAGAGTLVFNHTSNDYAFAPAMAGAGAIEAIAGTTRLSADSSAFTGAATIHEQATLALDGSLGGTLAVLAGGRLEGTGTAGTVNVAGTIAPGNSIGTLTVAGNYTQAPGSTYEVEIDAAGNSDLIDIAGTATLNGGTVQIIPFPDYALVTPYTILTAAGGLSGTFDGVSMDFSSLFVTPQLTYDANNAFFTIAQTASFDSVALTPNQKAAAAGADSLGGGNDLWTAIALLSSVDDALTAFDAISGEAHTSAGTMFVEDSRFLREAVGGRLRAAAAPETTGLAIWGQGFGSWADWDSDGNAAMLTRDTSGLFVGGDLAIAETWRLGLVTGYSHASFDIDDRASSGNVDSYHLGAYAGGDIGNLGLRFGGAYSWHGVETLRVAAFPGFADILTANYDAATTQIFGEAGYRIDAGSAGFEPFANLAYVDLHRDGFTESGGAAALTASSSSHDTFFTTLGLRADAVVPFDGLAARPYGTLGWRHAFGDTVPTSDFNFAGGSPFTIAGVPIAEDAAVIEAGLDLVLPGGVFSVGYSGQIGEGLDDHGLKARFELRF